MDLTVLKQQLFSPRNSAVADEWEQGVYRIVITILFLFYFSFHTLHDDRGYNTEIMVIVLSIYMILTLISFWSVYKYRFKMPARIYTNMLGDNAIITLGLITADNAGAPALVVYLWIILGNGFRFGLQYLFVCTLLAVTGFALSAYVTDYWDDNPYWLYTGYALIIIVPFYTSKLLKKLHFAIQQANEANQAKTEFLSNMSHELRTPLNGVIGASDILLNSKLDEQQQDLTETIHFSANALLDQIQDILDFSKIEERRYKLVKEEFNLSEVLASTYSMFHHEIDNKGLEFNINLNPSVQNFLYGDISIVRKVLINFIGNALKFTHKGSISIEVNGEQDSEGYKVLFAVIDTGVGIPLDRQHQIFDRFTQADESTTRSYGGTGLGTTIAKELIEFAGGRVGVESEENKGSNFWFELPLEIAKHKHSLAKVVTKDNKIACFVDDEYETELYENLIQWAIKPTFFKFDSEKFKTYLNMGYEYDTYIIQVSSVGHAQDSYELLSSSVDVTQALVIAYSHQEKSQALILPNNIFDYVLPLPFNFDKLFGVLFENWIIKTNKEKMFSEERIREQKGFQPLNIFMAEDNMVNQKVALQILNSVNHNVTICSNGEEALDHLELNEYDLLILDMNMPGLSGIDVLKAYRFMGYINTPVIMLSADATTKTRELCLTAGANAFITKPFHAENLLNTIQSLSKVKGSVISENDTLTQDVGILVDVSKVKKLYDLGGIDFIKNLLMDFENSAVDLLADVRQSCFAKNYKHFRDALHALKGSAADMGFIALVGQCEMMEKIKVFQLPESTTNKEIEILAKQIDNSLDEYNRQIGLIS